MTYGAMNTVNTADAEHASEAISDVSNVSLLNWERQLLTSHSVSKYLPLLCYIFSMSLHPVVEDSS